LITRSLLQLLTGGTTNVHQSSHNSAVLLGGVIIIKIHFVPGVGLDLAAEFYCLTCEESFQHSASMDSSQVEGSNLSDRSVSGSDRKRRSVAQGNDLPAKLFSCSLCAFTSRYSNHLKRHMRIHDGHKPFRCPVCPYASAQLVNLQRHGRTHTGEKPYRCQQCSYACSSLGNLRRHQRMHTQERPQRREKEKRQGRRKKSMNLKRHIKLNKSEKIDTDLKKAVMRISIRKTKS
uniref:C2H2-type domain-containing protein n=1 Tax=Amphiprion ocellaris TaxID=80972 RepID=A0AAQ5YID5_AMPOC